MYPSGPAENFAFQPGTQVSERSIEGRSSVPGYPKHLLSCRERGQWVQDGLGKVWEGVMEQGILKEQPNYRQQAPCS